MELVEDGLKVVVQLVSEIDVGFDDGKVLLAIRPRFVVTSVCVLEVASSRAVVPHEWKKSPPLLPADVEFSIWFFVDVAAP